MDKGCRPFPRTPFSASGIFLRCAPDRIFLDEAEHFLHNRDASVAASLRSDGVRDRPGTPFGVIPDSAFDFAGIPTIVLLALSSEAHRAGIQSAQPRFTSVGRA
jgi:hypothetical protein